MLDVFEIAEETVVFRNEFNYPDKYIVLTELLGGFVLIHDSLSEEVYTVIFEGEDQCLINGTLKPECSSFYGFLIDYFTVKDVQKNNT